MLPIFATDTEASVAAEVKKTQVTTPLRVAASPKANVVTSLPKGALVIQVNTVKGGWSYVQTNNIKGYVATSSLVVPSSKIKIVSSKNGLVMKENAYTKSKTVATLKYQMVVEDFGKVINNWHLVRYGNVLGYVDSKMITDSKPFKMSTNVNVTLLNTASTNGRKTGSLNKNTEVSVHSQLSNWAYITSGSLRGYVPSKQLSEIKKNIAPQTLKTFMELRPTKIKWMKYYFDGKVLQGNVSSSVYENEYESVKEYDYNVPSVHMSFSSKRFQMGLPDSDWIWTDTQTPLVQNKPTPILEFNWGTEKYAHIGNSYLRTTTGTITTPAGTFKNVVHIEEKFKNLSHSIHYYFAPGYGLVKVIDSKNRLSFELRSYK